MCCGLKPRMKSGWKVRKEPARALLGSADGRQKLVRRGVEAVSTPLEKMWGLPTWDPVSNSLFFFLPSWKPPFLLFMNVPPPIWFIKQ